MLRDKLLLNQVIGKYLPYLNVLACFWAKTEDITEECSDSSLQDLQFIYLFIYWLYWVFSAARAFL